MSARCAWCVDDVPHYWHDDGTATGLLPPRPATHDEIHASEREIREQGETE